MTPRRHAVFAGALALAAALPAARPAGAAGWAALAGPRTSAGYVDGGAYRGLSVECGIRPGTIRLVFPVPASGLPAAMDHTVTASVDGIAFLLPSRIETGGAGGGVLVHETTRAAAADLLAALRSGRSLEIATPLGHYTLPLRGSAAALGGLLRHCGE